MLREELRKRFELCRNKRLIRMIMKHLSSVEHGVSKNLSFRPPDASRKVLPNIDVILRTVGVKRQDGISAFPPKTLEGCSDRKLLCDGGETLNARRVDHILSQFVLFFGIARKRYPAVAVQNVEQELLS